MLKLNNVTKSFGKFHALDHLSMNIPKGCVYGLVGPNGAGKSTSIRVLTGVYRPDEGEATLEGQPVYENPEAKARMCSIPDEIFFFPSASIEDMRKYYQGIYPKFDIALYKRLFEAFRLPPNSPIRRFSKGMQKQAAFLLSICCRTDLMILDEPVDGLDPVMRRQVWSLLLSDVAKEDATILISSHNLRELEDICDHVGIMDRGKMLLERNLADIQGNVMKLQLVGDPPQGLDILHQSESGKLKTLVIRGPQEQIAQTVQAANPVYFDILPLSLEEIFIYELGGADYAVKNILL